MARTDRASRLVGASPGEAFRALIDRDALLAWLPPTGMTARFEHFDMRPGGSYRLVLTYTDGVHQGKAGSGVDVVMARVVDIDEGVTVVQQVDFPSDDPAYVGTMTMTWSVAPAPDGALVQICAEQVPEGISAQDHADGMNASLRNLDAYLAAHRAARQRAR